MEQASAPGGFPSGSEQAAALALRERLKDLTSIISLTAELDTSLTSLSPSSPLVTTGNRSTYSSSAAPAVLDSPWLAHHSPYLDWSNGSLMGWSVACHPLCLHSALSPSWHGPSQSPNPPGPVERPRAVPQSERGFRS